MSSEWNQRFLELCNQIRSWSKDPSSRVGCVITRPDRTVASLGYNGLPRGVEDTDARLKDRTTKYEMVIHAEANAILSAREPLHGYTLYCAPFPSCSRCMGMAIQAGITKVVTYLPTDEFLDRWGFSYDLAREMAAEAKVEIVLFGQ